MQLTNLEAVVVLEGVEAKEAASQAQTQAPGWRQWPTEPR